MLSVLKNKKGKNKEKRMTLKITSVWFPKLNYYYFTSDNGVEAGNKSSLNNEESIQKCLEYNFLS